MKADHIVEALTGDSGWKDMIPQVNSSDFPTQWVPSAYECSIIDAQAKEIEKLRGQNEQLREAAALVTAEAADRIEAQAKEIDALRNELCLKCGNYTLAHDGACDGCRWRRR